MSRKRILVLGCTGVDKAQIIRNLRAVCQTGTISLDFEKDFLFNSAFGITKRLTFLDDDIDTQAKDWLSAWTYLERQYLRDAPETPIILGMHGCYIRGHYGSRSILLIDRIVRDFRPDIVLTFISDVYDMWWRTEHRAGNDALQGRPTIEELLHARRSELIVGDMIAVAGRQAGIVVKNYMFSAYHPINSIKNLILSDQPRIVYLSFPISEPRRMLNRGFVA